MIVFPNAKINIGLQIKERRTDGYHHIETIFYPIQLHDALECLPTSTEHPSTELIITGLTVAGSTQNNLCIKAYQLLKNHFPDIPPVHLHLHKAIPMGAGLGGGSADGAFTLRLLCTYFSLDVPQEKLMAWSLELGSDCPFFLFNKPCFASGRGEILTPINLLGLSTYKILLVNPGIHISTADAFKHVHKKTHSSSLLEAIQAPIEMWKNSIENDFESYVCEANPALATLKKQLYDAGALYASMSGSGSTFYGIYPASTNPVLDFPKGYFTKWI